MNYRNIFIIKYEFSKFIYLVIPTYIIMVIIFAFVSILFVITTLLKIYNYCENIIYIY